MCLWKITPRGVHRTKRFVSPWITGFSNPLLGNRGWTCEHRPARKPIRSILSIKSRFVLRSIQLTFPIIAFRAFQFHRNRSVYKEIICTWYDMFYWDRGFDGKGDDSCLLFVWLRIFVKNYHGNCVHIIDMDDNLSWNFRVS